MSRLSRLIDVALGVVVFVVVVPIIAAVLKAFIQVLQSR